MTVQIMIFGIARDIMGQSDCRIELPEAATVGDLRAALLRQFPAFESVATLRFAVNMAYAADSVVLNATDDIALIPPVSGG